MQYLPIDILYIRIYLHVLNHPVLLALCTHSFLLEVLAYLYVHKNSSRTTVNEILFIYLCVLLLYAISNVDEQES